MQPLYSVTLVCNSIACLVFIKIICSILWDIHIIKSPTNATGRLTWITMRFSPKTRNRQQTFRIITCISGFLINIIQIPVIVLKSLPQLEDNPHLHRAAEFMSPFVEVVFIWTGFYSHISAVIERYERLDMVIPKSRQERWMTRMKYACLILYFTCTSSQIGCGIVWVVQYDTMAYCPIWADILLLVIIAITCILYLAIEMTLNLKLVILSIQSFKKSEPLRIVLTQNHHQEIKRQRKRAHYWKLQVAMISLYSFLLVINLTILALYLVSRVNGESEQAYFSVACAAMAMHVIASYRLLDLFLVKLKQAKKRTFSTTNQQPLQPINMYGYGDTSYSQNPNQTTVSYSPFTYRETCSSTLPEVCFK